jgi:DNA processing protein
MNGPSDELRAQLALQLVPGIGPRLTAALLERFGSAPAVLQAGAAELQEVPHIGAKLAGSIVAALDRVDVDAELALLTQQGIDLLVRGTPAYPAALAAIPDPPQLLYCWGSLTDADRKAVALVGSRSSTTYGRRAAERLAGGLVRAGWTVVSGLARGIDAAAHRGAIDAGGRTLAVLAGGLGRIYPPEHAELARDVRQSGALLSESSLNQEPMAGLFPSRNRIISGLSQAVVIVEAAERSGALITARWAAEQGRPVFAVPGPIDSEASGGSNALIRQGAVLVRGVDDILEELEGIPGKKDQPPAAAPPPELDPVHRRIWDCLAEGPKHLDEMVQQLDLPVPQLSGALMMLEMKKLVRRLPGNRYERF